MSELGYKLRLYGFRTHGFNCSALLLPSILVWTSLLTIHTEPTYSAWKQTEIQDTKMSFSAYHYLSCFSILFYTMKKLLSIYQKKRVIRLMKIQYIQSAQPAHQVESKHTNNFAILFLKYILTFIHVVTNYLP